MHTCPVHNVEEYEIGRMSPDNPIEYACQFCMNDIDIPECLHKHEGNCKGSLGIVMGASGMLLVMCDLHEQRYYIQQDAIKSTYWDNSPEY